MYLRSAAHTTPKKRLQWLPLAEFWYNTSYHTSLDCTPFKALYGIEPNYGLMLDLAHSSNPEAVDMLQQREFHSAMLKEKLQRAQQKMKQDADKNRTQRIFQVGEQVLLKLQPYILSCQPTVSQTFIQVLWSICN